MTAPRVESMLRVVAILATMLLCFATLSPAQQPPAAPAALHRGPREETRESDFGFGQRAVPVQLGTERRARMRRRDSS